jgi:transcriptional regulator with XRE-family HTH domain
MAKSFDELANRYITPQRRARNAARAKVLLAEMLLSEIRKLAGKSQTDLARILGVKQPGVSKLEQQDDMQISTLKKIVEALGGEVHIIARFPKADVQINQFETKPRKQSKKRVRELQELQLV